MRSVDGNRFQIVFVGQGDASMGTNVAPEATARVEPLSESRFVRSASSLSRPAPVPGTGRPCVANPRLAAIGDRISYLLAAQTANSNDDILKEWLNEACAQERVGRQTAVARIKSVKSSGVDSLDLQGLELTTLPDCLGRCANLGQLDVSFNRLISLPTLPPTLLKIDMSNNQLNSLPELPSRMTLINAHTRARRQSTVLNSPGSPQYVDHGINTLRLPTTCNVETPVQSPIMSLNVSNNPWSIAALDQIDTLPAIISVTFSDRVEAREKASDALNEQAPSAPITVAETSGCSEVEPMSIDAPSNSPSLLRTIPLTDAGHYKTEELRQRALSIFRLNIIDELVSKKVGPESTLAQRVQIKMEYHTMLAARFYLPSTVLPILPQNLVTLSKRDLDNAITHIAHREAGIEVLDFLTTWKPWEHEMRRHYPQAYRTMVKKLNRDSAWLSSRPDAMSTRQYAYACDDQHRRVTIETQACTMRCTLANMAENHRADLNE